MSKKKLPKRKLRIGKYTFANPTLISTFELLYDISVIIFSTIILIALIFIVKNFASIYEDTTPLTNICFAVAGGLASICFSWYRTYDAKDEETMKIIKGAGERYLFSGLSFVAASLLKYGYLRTVDLQKKYDLISKSFELVHLIFILAFGFSVLLFIVASIRILKYLYNKYAVFEKLPKNKYIIEEATETITSDQIQDQTSSETPIK